MCFICFLFHSGFGLLSSFCMLCIEYVSQTLNSLSWFSSLSWSLQRVYRTTTGVVWAYLLFVTSGRTSAATARRETTTALARATWSNWGRPVAPAPGEGRGDWQDEAPQPGARQARGAAGRGGSPLAGEGEEQRGPGVRVAGEIAAGAGSAGGQPRAKQGGLRGQRSGRRRVLPSRRRRRHSRPDV